MDIEDNLNRFKILVHEAGVTVAQFNSRYNILAARTDHSDFSLQWDYRGKLQPRIQSRLAGLTFATLRAMQDKAVTIDDHLSRMPLPPSVARKAAGPTATSSNVFNPTTASSSTTSARPPTPTRDGAKRGPLTEQERQYRRLNGLCIVCESPDHRARFCPIAFWNKKAATVSQSAPTGVKQIEAPPSSFQGASASSEAR